MRNSPIITPLQLRGFYSFLRYCEANNAVRVKQYEIDMLCIRRLDPMYSIHTQNVQNTKYNVI